MYLHMGSEGLNNGITFKQESNLSCTFSYGTLRQKDTLLKLSKLL